MESVALPIFEMVEQFQCPGCVCGHDRNCGHFKWDANELRCTGHVLGTFIWPNGNIALGMPKGFCKPGWKDDKSRTKNTIDIRLFEEGDAPEWNHLNVPVWAMEQDGYLFVRTFAPRVNVTWVDVIKGGTLAMVPNAINVGDFINDID